RWLHSRPAVLHRLGPVPRRRDASGDAAADGPGRPPPGSEVPRHWTAFELPAFRGSVFLQGDRNHGATRRPAVCRLVVMAGGPASGDLRAPGEATLSDNFLKPSTGSSVGLSQVSESARPGAPYFNYVPASSYAHNRGSSTVLNTCVPTLLPRSRPAS